jgi:hypothetical protein
MRKRSSYRGGGRFESRYLVFVKHRQGDIVETVHHAVTAEFVDLKLSFWEIWKFLSNAEV